jgi:fatty acid desaturase
MNAAAIYLGFTVLHEAMHGIAHPNRTLNALLGRLGGIPLTISFPLFRGASQKETLWRTAVPGPVNTK